ncbi:MAG: STAS domain-containing protein [Chloroflexota bacterium]|nr:STAS domain-containing protein [Chloroflexota bacterium]
MSVTIIDHDLCTVVEAHGSLDRRGAHELETALRSLIEDQGVACIVVDLSDVPYVSSAGLRVLISVARRLRSEQTGGDLYLASPSDRVVDTLDLAGLQPVFNLYDNRQQALRQIECLDPDSAPEDKPVDRQPDSSEDERPGE